MPIFENRVYNKKRSIPAIVKLLLLVAVIAGFMFRSCYNNKTRSNFPITEIKIEQVAGNTAEVTFRVKNPFNRDIKESIIIRLFTESGEEIASKITKIDLSAKSNNSYRKILQKFNRALKEDEMITLATVELYRASIFD